MYRFTIFCTEEQTRKALALCAPIDECSYSTYPHVTLGIGRCLIIPTAEEMIGWLEKRGILIDIDPEWNKSVLVYIWDCETKSLINHVFHGSRKDATLDAIDAALDYLVKAKEE